MDAKGQVVCLVLLLALLGGCDAFSKPPASDADKAAQDSPQDLVIPVEVARPVRGDIAAYLETTSRVTAENRVEVISEGIGKCTKVLVEEGERVERGDVLAELDKEEALASLHEAEVQVRKQQADFERVKRSIEEDGELIYSRQDYDQVRFAYEQGLATLNRQRIQLKNLTIRAPISGIITKRNVQLGMLVSSGSPVFSIVDPSSFQLVINLPERELQRLRIGQRAKVAIDALPDEEFEAAVSRINPSVDPVNGTVKVLLEFRKTDLDRLREAAFARVRLVIETHTDALLVPKETLLEDNGRKYLFVARQVTGSEENADDASDNKAGEPSRRHVAERVQVTTGLEDRDFAEILSGIGVDALVITRGHYNLKPGAHVKVTDVDAELTAHMDLSAADALEAARDRRAKDAGSSGNRRAGS